MDLQYLVHLGETNVTGEAKNASEPDVLQSPLQKNMALTLPYLILISIFLLCGTVGNWMVITSVFIDKELRNVGNLFIVNLAIADLCITGFVDPFTVVGIVVGEQWFLDRMWLCESLACICLTSCFCSLLSIGAISFNRYIHICHSSWYNRIYSLRKTLVMCISLWVISFLAEMPSFIGWGDHVYDKKVMSCVYDRTADLSYTVFFATVGVIFPILLISICYVRIYIFVRRSRQRVGQVRSQSDNTNAGREKRDSVKLARTLFLIFVFFAICWIPYIIIALSDFRDVYPTAVHAYFVALAHGSSSFNSVLYGVTNKQFRNNYIKILRCDRCLKNKPEETSFLENNYNVTMDTLQVPSIAYTQDTSDIK